MTTPTISTADTGATGGPTPSVHRSRLVTALIIGFAIVALLVIVAVAIRLRAGTPTTNTEETAAVVGGRSLWLSPTDLPPGGATMTVVIRNVGDQAVTAPHTLDLEVAAGDGWVEDGVATLCYEDFGCVGTIHPIGDDISTPAVAITIPPAGAVSALVEISRPVGRYRFVVPTSETGGARGPYAELTVSDDPGLSPTVVDPAMRHLSLDPVLVTPGEVDLDVWVKGAAELERCEQALHPTGWRMERWTGEAWSVVDGAPPIVTPAADSVCHASARVTVRAPGTYRIVRDAEGEIVEGRLFVVEP